MHDRRPSDVVGVQFEFFFPMLASLCLLLFLPLFFFFSSSSSSSSSSPSSSFSRFFCGRATVPDDTGDVKYEYPDGTLQGSAQVLDAEFLPTLQACHLQLLRLFGSPLTTPTERPALLGNMLAYTVAQWELWTRCGESAPSNLHLLMRSLVSSLRTSCRLADPDVTSSLAAIHGRL